ncbi:cytochrome-c peroxidase [Xanthobacter aminoxidans]|uniref:cytochrome-c peroxidase n=1 Tax=Xanthobacter aminoxidans TaxID=186280 RepID=UPI002022DE79|nr:cytochrome-c peroxidase [Xanthobacter aminoxidans]
MLLVALTLASTGFSKAEERGGELRAAYAGAPASWPRPDIDAAVAFVEMGVPPLPEPPRPKAVLGAKLFADPRVSEDGQVACASCHDPAHGFSVPERVGRGIGGAWGRRNPPSLQLVATRSRFDWDGRGSDLSARVLAPLSDPTEMGRDLISALARIAGTELEGEFRGVFGAEGLTARALAEALVAYLNTIDTPTRFDRFIEGDHTALNDIELAGLHLFRTKARCMNCHFGPMLSDGLFHNLRLSFFGEPAQDLGRFEATDSRDDVGRFRTPFLRHIGASQPYMHNGLFPTLAGVVNFYDRGGGEVWARNAEEAARPLYRDAARLSPHIRPLGLTEAEKAALVAFLNAL